MICPSVYPHKIAVFQLYLRDDDYYDDYDDDDEISTISETSISIANEETPEE